MPKVTVNAQANGPNLVYVDGKVVAALCRCGGSQAKPQCDGTHRKNGFQATATSVTIVP